MAQNKSDKDIQRINDSIQSTITICKNAESLTNILFAQKQALVGKKILESKIFSVVGWKISSGDRYDFEVFDEDDIEKLKNIIEEIDPQEKRHISIPFGDFNLYYKDAIFLTHKKSYDSKNPPIKEFNKFIADNEMLIYGKNEDSYIPLSKADWTGKDKAYMQCGIEIPQNIDPKTVKGAVKTGFVIKKDQSPVFATPIKLLNHISPNKAITMPDENGNAKVLYYAKENGNKRMYVAEIKL